MSRKLICIAKATYERLIDVVKIVGNEVVISGDELEKFLYDAYHPDTEVIRKRDEFLRSADEDDWKIVDGVPTLQIPDEIFEDYEYTVQVPYDLQKETLNKSYMHRTRNVNNTYSGFFESISSILDTPVFLKYRNDIIKNTVQLTLNESYMQWIKNATKTYSSMYASISSKMIDKKINISSKDEKMGLNLYDNDELEVA